MDDKQQSEMELFGLKDPVIETYRTRSGYKGVGINDIGMR